MTEYWEPYQADDAYVPEHSDAVRYAFDADEWQGFPVSVIFETYREAYQLSIGDVAAALKIRQDYLEALESGDYAQLPGRTFAVGYVRSFAHFLQLPVEDIVQQFKQEAYDLMGLPLAPLSIPEPPKDKHLSKGLIVLVSLVVLGISWGLWIGYLNGWSLIPNVIAATDDPLNPALPTGIGEDTTLVLEMDNQVSIIQQTGDIETPGSGPRVAIFGVPLPQIRPTAAERLAEPVVQENPSLPRVVVHANALAWIQVRNSRQEPIVAQMLQAGQSHVMPAETGLTLYTGSIEALSITVDNQKVALPARDQDTVVTQLSLNAADLQGLGAAL